MLLASVGAFLFVGALTCTPSIYILTRDDQGFDNGWWGTILGSQRFLSDYGSCTDIDGVQTCNLSAAQLSAGSSVQSAGISRSKIQKFLTD
jgi:hypothetical protein